MHSFRNDYSEGAHPLVLEELVKTNMLQTAGYTEDEFCDAARDSIRRAIANHDPHKSFAALNLKPSSLQVEFVGGGTVANLLVLTHALKSYEAVIAAPDAHINVHETGAIEANGHKVLTTLDKDGIITAAGVDAVMSAHEYCTNHHMVSPRLIYFSFATEMGLIHKRSELFALRAYADAHDLLIYIDGARLACGLAASQMTEDAQDVVTLGDICAVADAFSIGGTKNGALFGEALVIRNLEIGHRFRNSMKQKGALYAKGRLLGVQFNALFNHTGAEANLAEAYEDEELYFALGRHSVNQALKARAELARLGFETLASESTTNQQFFLLDNKKFDAFTGALDCEIFGRPDAQHSIARIVCSWATTDEDIYGEEGIEAALRKANLL